MDNKKILNESLFLPMFQAIADGYHAMYLLNAIWLDKKLMVCREGNTVGTMRLALTDNVTVKDGIIVDSFDNDATHRIIKLKGTIKPCNNEFEIQAMNLATEEIETIKRP